MMFVVTLPLSALKNSAAFARKAKKAGAEVLEIRGDLTPRVKMFRSALPLLVSPRGSGMTLIKKFKPRFVDLEMRERGLISDLPPGTKLIISMHDCAKTPSLSVLKNAVQKMCSIHPWMIKIALHINSYADIGTLEKLKDHLESKKLKFTVLGMGERAHLSRMLSPLRNTFTYACLSEDEASAAGQLSIIHYPLSIRQPNLQRQKPAPDIYGIIGGPHITRSLSPLIHNALFRRHKIHALYSCFPTTDFASTLKELGKLGLVGCSVTAPFKHEAFDVAAKRDRVTEELGVANTLVRKGSGMGLGLSVNGEWHAFNTDIVGIEKGYPFLFRCSSVAILGAGGAVPSAILAIRRLNPQTVVTVFAREPKKARRTLGKFSVDVQPLDSARYHTCDAVICAISEDTSIPLPKAHHAIDLRYGAETKFMKAAKRKGFGVYDGTAMLIHQALRQFEYFTGEKCFADDVEYLRMTLCSFCPSDKKNQKTRARRDPTPLGVIASRQTADPHLVARSLPLM